LYIHLCAALPPTPRTYTLSLHDTLPISRRGRPARAARPPAGRPGPARSALALPRPARIPEALEGVAVPAWFSPSTPRPDDRGRGPAAAAPHAPARPAAHRTPSGTGARPTLREVR